MLNDIHAQGSAVASRRLLAVIAPREDQPAEIDRQFSLQGENVEVVWYRNSGHLLAAGAKKHFDAVILFPAPGADLPGSNDEALRLAFGDTPLYHIEA
ncbi:MAG: hypothetical protein H7067_20115 [Burkholderiales bacterium]|nr:hypothetical protein [Opitutaceae bacterium]